MPPGLPVTIESVRAIGALEDPVLRNLWITAAYADFSQRLGVALPDDLTWCGFGVWASKTAGQSIRGDELPRLFGEILQDSNYEAELKAATRRTGWLERIGLAQAVGHRHVVNVLGDSAVAVSRSVAAGNVLVFDELGPLFVAFCGRLEAGPAAPADLLAAVQGALDAAPDHGGPHCADLEFAFGCYADAICATDPLRRAQLVLAGNIAAVAHEQRRLQRYIKSAIDAGVAVGLPDLVTDITPRPLRAVTRRIVRRALKAVTTELNCAWDTVTTVLLMSLQTADERLRFDHDLPPLPGGGRYPRALDQLDEPRAVDGWARWGPGASSTASDWERLEVRMNCIVHLFRSRQQHQPLRNPPYSAEQLRIMVTGVVPPAPL